MVVVCKITWIDSSITRPELTVVDEQPLYYATQYYAVSSAY